MSYQAFTRLLQDHLRDLATVEALLYVDRHIYYVLAAIIVLAICVSLIEVFLDSRARQARAEDFLLCETRREKQRHVLRIMSKKWHSVDTVVLRIALPTRTMRLGMYAGHAIRLYVPNPMRKKAEELGVPMAELTWNKQPVRDMGVEIWRNYTPLSHPDTKGFFEIAVRCYGPSVEYPEGGLMSSVVRRLEPDDYVTISGPHGRVGYVGYGVIRVRSEGTGRGPIGLHKASHFAMILGGTGMFPGFAIAQKILSDPRDPTSISLLYSVSSTRQLVFVETLRGWAATHKRRFKLEVVAERVTEGDVYDGEQGIVTERLLKRVLPPPSSDPLICLVGPVPMCSGHVRPLLRRLGYNMSRIVPF